MHLHQQLVTITHITRLHVARPETIGQATPATRLQVTAALALQRLACRHRRNQDAIRNCGGIELLVTMLEPSESDVVQRVGVCALLHLVGTNVGNIQAVRLADGVPDLVPLACLVLILIPL